MSDGSWGAIEECQPTYGNPRNIPVSDEGSRAEIPNEPLAANELCMVIAHPFSTQNSSTQNNVWPKLLAFCPKVTP
ncbi:MAG TPA: hypothetical protein VH234_02910 [Candidatus Saccharimonadales bacterium]|nr:hypothetical protein [Candidatus Saccharimonadales bacterium]